MSWRAELDTCLLNVQENIASSWRLHAGYPQTSDIKSLQQVRDSSTGSGMSCNRKNVKFTGEAESLNKEPVKKWHTSRIWLRPKVMTGARL